MARPSPAQDPLALAEALITAGEPLRAVVVLQRALARGRAGPNARVALGRALMLTGHLPAAIAEFEHVVRLDPSSADAQHALGLAWLEAGEPDRAIETLSKLDSGRFSADIAEKIAAAHAMKTTDRSPPGYVRHLFDQFSSRYDAHMLRELNYRAHLILRELADLMLPVQQGLDILDLGCGTGLTGAAFADVARRLDGVDLSPRMIEKARARGVYHTLIVADLETALAARRPSYDLILAADTFVYLGDLVAVFGHAARRLKPGGCLLFTLEQDEGENYRLGPKRRYRHSEAYVRRESARSGLEIMGLLQCTPRSDARQPVNGLAAALQRPHS